MTAPIAGTAAGTTAETTAGMVARMVAGMVAKTIGGERSLGTAGETGTLGGGVAMLRAGTMIGGIGVARPETCGANARRSPAPAPFPTSLID